MEATSESGSTEGGIPSDVSQRRGMADIPEDIIAALLKMAVDVSPDSLSILDFSQVSRLWRRVALARRDFWTRIAVDLPNGEFRMLREHHHHDDDDDDDVEFYGSGSASRFPNPHFGLTTIEGVTEWIRRAGGAPLEVVVNISGKGWYDVYGYRPGWAHATLAVRRLWMHCVTALYARCVRMSFEGDLFVSQLGIEVDMVAGMLKKSAPHLRVLHLPSFALEKIVCPPALKLIDVPAPGGPGARVKRTICPPPSRLPVPTLRAGLEMDIELDAPNIAELRWPKVGLELVGLTIPSSSIAPVLNSPSVATHIMRLVVRLEVYVPVDSYSPCPIMGDIVLPKLVELELTMNTNAELARRPYHEDAAARWLPDTFALAPLVMPTLRHLSVFFAPMTAHRRGAGPPLWPACDSWHVGPLLTLLATRGWSSKLLSLELNHVVFSEGHLRDALSACGRLKELIVPSPSLTLRELECLSRLRNWLPPSRGACDRLAYIELRSVYDGVLDVGSDEPRPSTARFLDYLGFTSLTGERCTPTIWLRDRRPSEMRRVT